MAQKRHSLKRNHLPIPIEKEDGSEVDYTLRELTGAQRNEYLNGQNKKITTKGKDNVEIKDFNGMCSDLLSLCLYDEQGVQVRADVIDNWPSGMQWDIYKQAVKLSGLNQEGADEAKNA